MAIRRFSTAEPGVKSNRFWDQDTQQGAIVPITSVTVTGSSDTSMGFTNIPQIYQDLMIVVQSRRTDAVTEGQQFFYTGYAGAIASVTKMFGAGAGVQSSRNNNQNALFIGAYPGASATSGIFGTQIIHILGYSNTSRFKTVITRTAADRVGTGGQVELSVGLLKDTSGLTSCGVSTYNASVYYVPGSTMTLYGIKAGA